MEKSNSDKSKQMVAKFCDQILWPNFDFAKHFWDVVEKCQGQK